MREISSPPPFQQLGSSVMGVADAYRHLPRDFAPPYKSGSRAWKDMHSERRFTGDWSKMPVRNLHSEALGYMARAEDHLRGCGHLVGADFTVFSPVSLGRTVITATSFAYWLLEPDIEPNERLRRSMNIRLNALDEQVEMTPEDNPFRATVADKIAKILAAAEAVDLTPHTIKTRWGAVRHHIGDKPLPSETQLVRALLDHDEGPGHGRFVYQLYSAAVHANPNSGAITDMVPTGNSIEGVSLTGLHIGLDKMAQLALTPTYAFYLGCERVMDYFGQPRREFDDAAFPHLTDILRTATT